MCLSAPRGTKCCLVVQRVGFYVFSLSVEQRIESFLVVVLSLFVLYCEQFAINKLVCTCLEGEEVFGAI